MVSLVYVYMRDTGVELRLTKMRPSWITAPCVIVLSANSLEGCGLVNGNAAGSVLVFEIWVLHRCTEGRELVRLPGSHWRLGFRSGQIMSGFVCGY